VSPLSVARRLVADHPDGTSRVPGSFRTLRAMGATVDATDATFQAEVIDTSMTTPVVVDLWAPWCGPCKQLGPILESVVASLGDSVKLVKVNIDENPSVAQAFQVQSIPAVFGITDGKVVDAFLGARPEHEVREFIEKLVGAAEPTELDRLIEAGDEASLRAALELAPAEDRVIIALAELLVGTHPDEALELLARIPETPHSRHIAAVARAGSEAVDDVEVRLAELLPRVKADADARQAYVDLLELLGPDDPRTVAHRKKLMTALY